MAITLTPSPKASNAKLEPADVAEIIGALTPLVTLAEDESWIDVIAVNLNIAPDSSGALNIRFKQ